MEEISCLNCVHITDEYMDCEKYCGSKNGWCEYETIGERIYVKKDEDRTN